MSNSRPRGTSSLDTINRHFLWKQLLLILCAVVPAGASHAQQTYKLTVSGAISSTTEGFQYRHVEIVTSNGLPAPKDISVWCHVELQNVWGQHAKMVQPIPVTLKAGEVLVEKELYLPSGGAAGAANFSLTAKGNSSRKRLLDSSWGVWNINCQDVLIIDGAGVGESHVTFNRNKRIRNPVEISPDCQNLSGATSKGNSIQLSALHSKIAYLPTRWIGYSSVEQVIIDSADLATLSLDVERFGALIEWVTMGGALIVSDCGDDFKSVLAVKRYFKDGESGVVPEMTLYAPSDNLKNERRKLVNDFTVRSPVASGMGANFQATGRRSDFVSTTKDGGLLDWNAIKMVPGKAGGLELDVDTDVLLHRFGLGQIMFHSAPVKDLRGKQLLGACFICFAAQQHENVLGSTNAIGDSLEKWQLLNVGVAPIGLFMFVVVSFMTLIGPVGYSYLKMKRKLNYQIWMVPLFSALACLSLLGYAFLTEGVGTKLRPTIFVELDQHRKVAATFGRYSVYSALQPPPYQFADDQFATLENANDKTPAIYRWSDEGYRLSGGNASARNVHQVFVAAPVKTNSGFEIKEASDSGSPASLSLTNRFQDEVKLLVVKDDGKLYFATDLAPSETQVRPPLTDDKLFKVPEVKAVLKGRLPTNTQNYRFDRRGRFYSRGFNNYQIEWDVGVKHIEKFRSASEIERHLEDGHYIAILDSMTEVPSVVTGAREIDGSVIVHGKW